MKTNPWQRWARSPSKTVLAISLAWLAGVVAAASNESVRPAGGWLALAVAFFLGLALLAWRRPFARLLALGGLACLLATWRYQSVLTALPEPPAWPNAATTSFRGKIDLPPRQLTDGTVLRLDSLDWRLSDGEAWQTAQGRFRLRFAPPTAMPLGATVAWTCRLSDTEIDQWYFLEGIVGSCRIRSPPTVVTPPAERPGPVDRLREVLRAATGRLWPEPEASFMLGLLIGDRDGIPWEMVEAFRETGTSHILAVSGYNISRVVGLAMLLAAGCRLRRRLAVLLAAGSVIGFAALVGGQASVVRAALMGCIGLLAILLSRQSGGGGALWLTAAAMLAWSPLSLKHDVGFQLSFAAVWGLGAFGPKMADWCGFLPASLGIRQSAAESLAATLATVPVIMFVFGRLPLIGPMVNALILPLIPWSMLLGALAIAVAPFGRWLALPFAWLAYALLWLVGTVVNQSARLGFWAIEADISPWLTILMFGGLAALAWRWRPAARQKADRKEIEA